MFLQYNSTNYAYVCTHIHIQIYAYIQKGDEIYTKVFTVVISDRCNNGYCSFFSFLPILLHLFAKKSFVKKNLPFFVSNKVRKRKIYNFNYFSRNGDIHKACYFNLGNMITRHIFHWKYKVHEDRDFTNVALVPVSNTQLILSKYLLND